MSHATGPGFFPATTITGAATSEPSAYSRSRRRPRVTSPRGTPAVPIRSGQVAAQTGAPASTKVNAPTAIRTVRFPIRPALTFDLLVFDRPSACIQSQLAVDRTAHEPSHVDTS